MYSYSLHYQKGFCDNPFHYLTNFVNGHICLFIYISISLSIYLSITYIYLSIYLSIIYLSPISIYHLSIYLSIYHPFSHLSSYVYHVYICSLTHIHTYSKKGFNSWDIFRLLCYLKQYTNIF